MSYNGDREKGMGPSRAGSRPKTWGILCRGGGAWDASGGEEGTGRPRAGHVSVEELLYCRPWVPRVTPISEISHAPFNDHNRENRDCGH